MISKSLAALLLPSALATDALYHSAEGLGVYIGTAFNIWKENDKNTKYYDQQYIDFEIKNFDLITAEGTCKMNWIAKSATNFDYTQCQQVRDFAKANGQAFRAHNLIWPNITSQHRSPAFTDNMNKDQLVKYMYNYINKTVRAIGSYPIAWDVLNEYIDDRPGVMYKTSTWSKIPDFACQAFRAASKAAASFQGNGPTMGMFYNDYDILSGSGWSASKADKVFDFVKELKRRNCGITGIGMQAHINTNYDLMDGVAANFKRYADIGIIVHITELDIGCTTCGKTWTEPQRKQQAKVYTDLLTICLQAENCRSFETWGFTDKYSWLGGNLDGDYMDKNMVAKEAYTDVNRTLYQYSRNHSAVIARNKAIAKEGRTIKTEYGESVEDVQFVQDDEYVQDVQSFLQ